MQKLRALILVFLTSFAITGYAQGPTTLQPGTPIERTLGPGQVHEFSVNLEENTYIQVAVEQRGIDVIVKVFSPGNKSLGEFDSPNGNDGPENVSFVAVAAGNYRLTVGPLSGDSPEGRYQIKIIELRQATDQELKTSKNQEVVKAKGLALLTEVEGLIAQIKSPPTRISSELQAAQLLWQSDEKRASKYLSDAITSVKEFLATMDPSSERYSQQHDTISQLRHEIIQVLAPRDPDAALSFLYSTVPATNPMGDRREQLSQESALELMVVNQIMQNDPNRALQIVRRNLKRGYTGNLMSVLLQLQRQRPEQAAELATEIANRLLDQKLLNDNEAANLAMNLVRSYQVPQRKSQTPAQNRAPLLSPDKYQELLQKIITEALSYIPVRGPHQEREPAFNMLGLLQTFGTDLDTIMPGAASAVRKKFSAIDGNPEVLLSQPDQTVITNGPVDTALEAIEKASPELKEQLYLNLANREAMTGDIARAKQIINDHFPNGYQRHALLANIEQQQIYRALNKGKAEEALRAISTLRTPRERAAQLSQIAGQIGPGQKRATAINLLEQARSMLGPSVQAQDEDHMRALFEIGRAFSRYDSKRAFEIIDPLIDQINDLCAAARVLDGFGPEYFENEELNLQSGVGVNNVAGQMTTVLGSLAVTNFERAKAAADRIGLPELKLKAYLEIAQQTVQAAK